MSFILFIYKELANMKEDTTLRQRLMEEAQEDLWKVIQWMRKAPVLPEDQRSPEDQSQEAIREGWYIPRECQGRATRDLLDKTGINPWCSFYRKLEDLEEAEASGERLIHQMMHYIGAYFFNETWTPEDDCDESELGSYMKDGSIKIIYGSTPEDLRKDVLGALGRKQALPSDLVKAAVLWASSVSPLTEDEIEGLGNREARAWAYIAGGTMPSKGEDIMRMLLVAGDWGSVIIKSKSIFRSMSFGWTPNGSPLVWELLHEMGEPGCEALAQDWRRYKPLLLSLKKGAKVLVHFIYKMREEKNPGLTEGYVPEGADETYFIDIIKKINYISRLSRKLHEPAGGSPWTSILCPGKGLDSLAWASRNAHSLEPTRLVRLIQGANLRIMMPNDEELLRIFRIRNGKAWLRSDKSSLSPWLWGPDCEYIFAMKDVLVDALVEKLRPRLKDYKYFVEPSGVRLACPSSGKDFVGVYPSGSRIQMDPLRSTFLGVYWRGEWGAQDIDLSYINERGMKIGWDSLWSGDGISFSGDMVRAEPEASEVLRFPAGEVPSGLIYANIFSGSPGCKATMFGGQGLDETPERGDGGWIIPPETVMFKACASLEARESLLGLVDGGEILMASRGSGEGRISSGYKYFPLWVRGMRNSLRAIPLLGDVLERCGLKRREKVNKRASAKTLDLSQASAQSLMELFG